MMTSKSAEQKGTKLWSDLLILDIIPNLIKNEILDMNQAFFSSIFT